MELRILTREDLALALPMRAAIEAMRSAFIALAQGRVDAPQRVPVKSESGVTLLMGAAAQGIGLTSKTVSIFDENGRLGKSVVNGLLLVLDPKTGEPLGLCDGATVTAIRTGAVVGAVTDVLARPAAKTGALIGCGVQARTQLQAMDTVRSLEVIYVYGPDESQLQAFIKDMQPDIQAELLASIECKQAVENADIVTAATNARQPVIDGRYLQPHCHLNGVGSYTLEMRELDRESIKNARIFVDQIGAALHESGELVDAERAGLTERSAWTEIGELFQHPESYQHLAETRTLFKSVGHAVQDVAAATLAFDRARMLGLGTTIEL